MRTYTDTLMQMAITAEAQMEMSEVFKHHSFEL